MARNVLLTSLGALGDDLSHRYFSAPSDSGLSYTDALLDAEASIKAILASSAIDDVFIIATSGSYGDEDVNAPASLTQGEVGDLQDLSSLSDYGVLRVRLAQYAKGVVPDKEAGDESLPEEVEGKLVDFIRRFGEREAGLKAGESGRLFDAFARDDEVYERFRTQLVEAYPELADVWGLALQRVKEYLYAELDDSLKLRLLPQNEKTNIHLIARDFIAGGKQWADSMVSMRKSIVQGEEDANLYVALNGDDAVDSYVVINMLNILVSMPESGFHLSKVFTLSSSKGHLCAPLHDVTDGFAVTEFFHAISAFLNYGKADKISEIWEASGEDNANISEMVHAMRCVDVGLSMCNVEEVEGGILRLRKLFGNEQFWHEAGYFGIMFTTIAESIKGDYGALLEGDGDIPFIDLVRWAYRHQFYQQTLTLIESKAPQNLVKSGVFYYCDSERSRGRITELFARERLGLKPYEYFKISNIDHYFIKLYNRAKTKGLGAPGEDRSRVYANLRAASTTREDSSEIRGFTALDNRRTLEDVLFAYYHVSEVRNKISHADSGSSGRSRLLSSGKGCTSALEWMLDGIDFFIESYDKARSEVKGKKPHVVLISGEEVREVAEDMRDERRRRSRVD